MPTFTRPVVVNSWTLDRKKIKLVIACIQILKQFLGEFTAADLGSVGIQKTESKSVIPTNKHLPYFMVWGKKFPGVTQNLLTAKKKKKKKILHWVLTKVRADDYIRTTNKWMSRNVFIKRI